MRLEPEFLKKFKHRLNTELSVTPLLAVALSACGGGGGGG